MMRSKIQISVLMAFVLLPAFAYPQPADSPEAAGITPITGDLAPWRDYGVDMTNFDSVWVIALNNGSSLRMRAASSCITR